eukprot:scaffold306227_cov35-Tisochrysis_lutea.AAC.4
MECHPATPSTSTRAGLRMPMPIGPMPMPRMPIHNTNTDKDPNFGQHQNSFLSRTPNFTKYSQKSGVCVCVYAVHAYAYAYAYAHMRRMSYANLSDPDIYARWRWRKQGGSAKVQGTRYTRDIGGCACLVLGAWGHVCVPRSSCQMLARPTILVARIEVLI